MNRRQFLRTAATGAAAATATAFVMPGQAERYLLKTLGPPPSTGPDAADVAATWRRRFEKASKEAREAHDAMHASFMRLMYGDALGAVMYLEGALPA